MKLRRVLLAILAYEAALLIARSYWLQGLITEIFSYAEEKGWVKS